MARSSQTTHGLWTWQEASLWKTRNSRRYSTEETFGPLVKPQIQDNVIIKKVIELIKRCNRKLDEGLSIGGHGQNATKAAVRACRNAIEFNSIPSIGKLVPGGYDNMRLAVELAHGPCSKLRLRLRKTAAARPGRVRDAPAPSGALRLTYNYEL